MSLYYGASMQNTLHISDTLVYGGVITGQEWCIVAGYLSAGIDRLEVLRLANNHEIINKYVVYAGSWPFWWAEDE